MVGSIDGRNLGLAIQGNLPRGVGPREADRAAAARHAPRRTARRSRAAARAEADARVARIASGHGPDSGRLRPARRAGRRLGRVASVRLLLDTHIWLWSALDPSRLSRRVADSLENPANELWLSPISVWEALMLAERGRVALEPNGPRWVQETLDAIPIREAPINHAVAFESRRLRVGPRDPADRFLAE